MAKRRDDAINSLIQRFGYTSYLEIGCKDDYTFSRIASVKKEGCDPTSGGTHRMTSDVYFERHGEPNKFDIVFIDGLHEAHQVGKDIENSLKCLRPNGTIVLHDCNPCVEEYQIVPRICARWNGDVWKAFVALRRRKDLDCATGDFDHGIGIIRVRPNSSHIDFAEDRIFLWSDLVANRNSWLRLMNFDDLMSFAG